MSDNKKEHLPLFGAGPVMVFGQFIITAAGIALKYMFGWEFAEFDFLEIPLFIAGVILILFGIYLDLSAKFKSKLFKKIEENKLITDGVYSIVRNPVYSGALMGCIGAVLITGNLLLLVCPVICWIYLTIFLIFTEEKWLADAFGDEYTAYCKRVNRCIPWFPAKR